MEHDERGGERGEALCGNGDDAGSIPPAMELSAAVRGGGMGAGGAAPVVEGERINALDCARGLALLGIFFVNIQLFAMPLATMMESSPGAGESCVDKSWFYFEKVFCEGKFFPLFSLLFGMGLMLQRGRAEARGATQGKGSFTRIYLRRLAVLMVMGLIHAWVLWYGDILFLYSIAGLILFLSSKASARLLIWLGASFLGLGAVLMIGLGLLGAVLAADPDVKAGGAGTAGQTAAVVDGVGADGGAAETDGGGGVESPTAAETSGQPEAEQAKPELTTPEPPVAKPESEADGDASAPGEGANVGDAAKAAAEEVPLIIRLFRAMGRGEVNEGAMSPMWREVETELYRDGPYWQALIMRVMTWFFMVMQGMFTFGWTILGMFFLGAGLMKAGVFEREHLWWHRWFALAGFGVGLPLVAMSVWSRGSLPEAWGMLTAMAGMALFGPVMSFGYLGAVTLLAHGPARRVVGLLANTGRMALTLYLMQTLISTFTFYHWGLGLFGSFTRSERCVFVLSVYACQLVFAILWLSVFRMGPMEWVWRSLTYWKAQRIFWEARGVN